ncbi:hypothetical protein pb186bvf_002200 [Paramecium bursaria]
MNMKQLIYLSKQWVGFQIIMMMIITTNLHFESTVCESDPQDNRYQICKTTKKYTYFQNGVKQQKTEESTDRVLIEEQNSQFEDIENHFERMLGQRFQNFLFPQFQSFQNQQFQNFQFRPPRQSQQSQPQNQYSSYQPKQNNDIYEA